MLDDTAGISSVESFARGESEASKLTRNAALYGTPIGRFAKMAKSRLASGALNARLWEISCMERNRFWFAVAPIMYAVKRNGKDSIGVFRRSMAQINCRVTTARTTYFVNGSGPQSFVTCDSRQLGEKIDVEGTTSG